MFHRIGVAGYDSRQMISKVSNLSNQTHAFYRTKISTKSDQVTTL
ncbi:hypothetical protein LINPERPRIM_LOCUS16284 [Linum perenne]